MPKEETKNEIKIEITFEQKKEILCAILDDYSLGFLTPTECIIQILNINWNEFERILINQTLEKTVIIDFLTFKQLII